MVKTKKLMAVAILFVVFMLCCSCDNGGSYSNGDNQGKSVSTYNNQGSSFENEVSEPPAAWGMGTNDINKTGPQNLVEIRKQNPLTPEEIDSDLKKIGKKALESISRQSPREIWEAATEYKHSQYKDPVEWAYELRQAGYGESKYDALIPPTTNIEEIQENRALNQSTGEQMISFAKKVFSGQ